MTGDTWQPEHSVTLGTHGTGRRDFAPARRVFTFHPEARRAGWATPRAAPGATPRPVARGPAGFRGNVHSRKSDGPRRNPQSQEEEPGILCRCKILQLPFRRNHTEASLKMLSNRGAGVRPRPIQVD